MIPGQGTKIPHATQHSQETFLNSKMTDLLTLFKPNLGHSWASLVAQMIKSLPAMLETQVQSLGQEDHPREGNSYPLQYSGLKHSMDRGA